MPYTLMVSPCGTSTLTNQAGEHVRSLLTRTANAREQDLSFPGKQTIDQYLSQREQDILSADVNQVRRWSAELNGILAYYDGQLPPQTDIHLLLATATYQGQKTADLIARWLQAHGCHAEVHPISRDLNVGSAEAFRVAMAELVQWVEDTIPGYRQHQYQVVFNLTGGFKSVNGFLQTIGMFYADECVYIFQDSRELIRIPRLPVKLDAESIIGEHLLLFRRLGVGATLPLEDCRSIPETLLFIHGNQAVLSEWGKLVWNRCKASFYSQGLLEPLSAKIRYSEAFQKAVHELPPERQAIINERLDQLSRYLDDPKARYNPSSLDFKPLRGNPCPPSTHECDAWSDLDAKRIFGHFEEGVFVIDRLDKGLH